MFYYCLPKFLMLELETDTLAVNRLSAKENTSVLVTNKEKSTEICYECSSPIRSVRIGK